MAHRRARHHVFPARLPKLPAPRRGGTAKGRYGYAGNGGISSRIWKENMFELTAPVSGPEPVANLTDPQGRRLEYLRLAVTDRCNLRCRYCMPAEGVASVGHDAVLRFEEMIRLAGILCGHGINRIRITGGEPLVRKGVVGLIENLAALPEQPEVLLTTNGLLLAPHLPALAQAGVRRINLSLDSLDPANWERITRRGGHAKVLQAIDDVLAAGLGLKLNVVVLPGVNDHELVDFAALTRERKMTVRFIEAMGFDGSGQPVRTLGGDEIVGRLASAYELLAVPRHAGAVADTFRISGHVGQVGVIRGHSRTFCGDCSRLRVDTQGRLRTCLYGVPAVDLRAMVRAGASDDDLLAAIRGAVGRRHPDGHAAAAVRLDSMANIGG